MSVLCPVCERGHLQAIAVDEVIPYAGAELTVHQVEVSRCDLCGEETVLPDQLKRNELRFVDAKRRHDDLMTSQEIVTWREELRITQAQAAEILGGGVNAFSKYERGEVIQSRAMDQLMRVSQRFSEVRRYLFQRAGLAVPERGWICVAPDPEHCEVDFVEPVTASTLVRTAVVEQDHWVQDVGMSAVNGR